MNAARRKTLRAVNFVRLRVRINELKTDLESARETIEQVRDEEQESYDNLPDVFHDGERGEAMNEAIEQMETLIDALEQVDELDTLLDAIDDFESNFAW